MYSHILTEKKKSILHISAIVHTTVESHTSVSPQCPASHPTHICCTWPHGSIMRQLAPGHSYVEPPPPLIHRSVVLCLFVVVSCIFVVTTHLTVVVMCHFVVPLCLCSCLCLFVVILHFFAVFRVWLYSFCVSLSSFFCLSVVLRVFRWLFAGEPYSQVPLCSKTAPVLQYFVRTIQRLSDTSPKLPAKAEPHWHSSAHT